MYDNITGQTQTTDFIDRIVDQLKKTNQKGLWQYADLFVRSLSEDQKKIKCSLENPSWIFFSSMFVSSDFYVFEIGKNRASRHYGNAYGHIVYYGECIICFSVVYILGHFPSPLLSYVYI